MLFTITYGEGREVNVTQDSREAALAAFKKMKPAVPESEIKEVYPVSSPSGRVIYRDPRTNLEITARKDFTDGLPNLLKVGEENAILVEKILEMLGAEINEANRRQLRHAKEYLVIEKRLPICALRSQVGGYFIAASASELIDDANAYRAQAAGLINVAENLETLSKEYFGVK